MGSKKITLNHVIDVFSKKRSLSCTEFVGPSMDESLIGPSLQAKWFLCWDPQICRVTESLNVGGKPKNHLQKKGILWNPPNSTGKGSFYFSKASVDDWWPHDFWDTPISRRCSKRFPQKTGRTSSTICITQSFSSADATVKVEWFKGIKQLQQRYSYNKIIIIVFYLSDLSTYLSTYLSIHKVLIDIQNRYDLYDKWHEKTPQTRPSRLGLPLHRSGHHLHRHRREVPRCLKRQVRWNPTAMKGGMWALCPKTPVMCWSMLIIEIYF